MGQTRGDTREKNEVGDKRGRIAFRESIELRADKRERRERKGRREKRQGIRDNRDNIDERNKSGE